MNRVLRFDVLTGCCAICDGPVYFSRVIDWEGNRVNTLHCWNGHYESIEIDHIDVTPDDSLTPEHIEKILPFVDFIRLTDKSG